MWNKNERHGTVGAIRGKATVGTATRKVGEAVENLGKTTTK
jgi:hypothetical protein